MRLISFLSYDEKNIIISRYGLILRDLTVRKYRTPGGVVDPFIHRLAAQVHIIHTIRTYKTNLKTKQHYIDTVYNGTNMLNIHDQT